MIRRPGSAVISQMQETTSELRWLIVNRFRKITASPEQYGFRYRILKGGSFRRKPVRIYEYNTPGLKRWSLLTADAAAHFLTTADSDYSGTARHIILWPALEITDHRILTHLWDSETATLVIYMYPQYWNESVPVLTADRFREISISGPGLADTVFQSIEKQKKTDILCFTAEINSSDETALHELRVISDVFTEPLYAKHEIF